MCRLADHPSRRPRERNILTRNVAIHTVPPDAIQIEQRRFKSPVDFEMNGHEVLIVEPDEKIYVGDSWEEIDRNWEELLWGRYFSISEEEAKSLWPDDYLDYMDPIKSGWTGG